MRKKTEFDRVQKEGEKFFAKLFLLNYAKNDLGTSRIGIIVSTKVSKRAVKRNLLRRRIRESMQLLLPQTKAGFDIVIIASKNMIQEDKPLPYQVIHEELGRALKNAKLLT